MDIISAYREVGSYRSAAQLCGTTPKTVRRVIERHDAGGDAPPRVARGHNYDAVTELVAARIEKAQARISAKRLLPAALAAGYAGSARNFRRLVATQKQTWRVEHHRGRRPAVWSPGEMLVIDWGSLGGVHVFCAVLAWSRVRFVRFATDERAETTFAMLAECFAQLGGVPKVVLADRMGCLKGGVVANVVVPTPAYVRLASHYRFRPDFCEAHDPESKGIVENLVGYATSWSPRASHSGCARPAAEEVAARRRPEPPRGVGTFTWPPPGTTTWPLTGTYRRCRPPGESLCDDFRGAGHSAIGRAWSFWSARVANTATNRWRRPSYCSCWTSPLN
jgi:transposase